MNNFFNYNQITDRRNMPKQLLSFDVIIFPDFGSLNPSTGHAARHRRLTEKRRHTDVTYNWLNEALCGRGKFVIAPADLGWGSICMESQRRMNVFVMECLCSCKGSLNLAPTYGELISQENGILGILRSADGAYSERHV